MADARSVGALLRRHRRAAGLTQEALAERAGLSARGIQDIERGSRRPYLDTARRLAAALHLNANDSVAFLAASGAALRGRDGWMPAPPAALPRALTSFVGRAAELELIGRLLGATRLLTLTGPPGVGKTRLAVAAAGAASAAFRDGVHFVPVASASEPEQVTAALAAALGVREAGTSAALAGIAASLREGRRLLVLDNFEQAVEAAPLVAELLAACPQLTVLVTSRAALRLAAEHRLQVPPLGLPDVAGLSGPEELLKTDAIALFVQRAQAVSPAFAHREDNASAVAGICARLDGLPLAIELAAARIRLLPPRAMLERLDNRMAVLTGGPRDLPPRQRTLRAAIAWSHDLLGPAERTLYGRLSVFDGGWTLDAAEAVCAPGGDLDVLGGLEALLDQSLIRREEEPDGDPRLAMLETVREHAWALLSAGGETAALVARHASYYRALAEQAAPHLRGPRFREWIDRLERERDNLQAALARSHEAGDHACVAQLAVGLAGFWQARGRLGEGRRWLELALDDPSLAAGLRARALVGVSGIAWEQGDFAASRHMAERGLRLARELGDLDVIGVLLVNLGMVAFFTGDLEGAGAACAESLGIYRASGDAAGATMSLIVLSLVALGGGDTGLAIERCAESLELARRAGDAWGTILSLTVWALAAIEAGDHELATARCADSLSIAMETGMQRGIASNLDVFGAIAAVRRHPARAARLWGASAALRAKIGLPHSPQEEAWYGRFRRRARETATEEAWSSAWAEGGSMPLAAACEYALGNDAEARGKPS